MSNVIGVHSAEAVGTVIHGDGQFHSGLRHEQQNYISKEKSL